ncbi:alpha/beta hydrolase [Kitasatospora arboriphila]|uniref:Alpha/beta hydrolase-fold protein n=1 Tax=Kitasatospora arboriphila TaxID=258052 RepID=A0ABN1TF60_9ACTN
MDRSLASWNPLDWPITTGVVPYALLVAGSAALLLLVLVPAPRWWPLRLPAAVLAAAAGGVLTALTVNSWWQPFAGGLPDEVTAWIALALLGLALAVARFVPTVPPRTAGKVLVPVAALLVGVMAASQVNRFYDEYGTLRAMLAPATEALPTGRDPHTVAAPPGGALAQVWHPPPGLPARGTLARTPIPGAKSGFDARDAYVWLPPAYRASPRPLLPVLVLMAGQPGSPSDWVSSGQLETTMNDFAAAHGGLAPIVLMVDQTGSTWGNSLCMDSRIARAQTYLAEDVPDWTRRHLQTAQGRRSWAIGGLSLGGTCALQLAVNAPRVYGTFLDISGQREPTLGSHQQTVQRAFGGDEAAFDAVDPLHVMARERFPDTAATFVVGDEDGEYGPQQRTVHAAAVAAGMKARSMTVPGGHDWNTFRAGLADNVTWLAQQTGLIT